MVGTHTAADTPSEDEPGGKPRWGASSQSMTVALGDRSYQIEIGTESIGTMATQIVAATDLTHAIIFYDIAVEGLAKSLIGALARVSGGSVSGGTVSGGTVSEADGANSIRCDSLAIESGEPSKSISQYAELLEFCLQRGGDRRSVVIALGGGVIGDLAGFVAATYTRGVRFVQIPTTLLAMVDSSVGGKTGVNLPGGKNMVGAFWQPELVLIDSALLETLPPRDFVSGIAEIIKYGMIDDAAFFDWLVANIDRLRNRDHAAIRFAIGQSCQCKADVVAADERETSGRRAILNYGHTFAHAIEATAGYGRITHGEAVAIGMEMAMELAVDLKMILPDDQIRQRDLIAAAGLPIRCRDVDVVADAEAMIHAMATDKKVANGNLRFVLPSRIGRVELVGNVDSDLVRKAIHSIG